MSSFADREIVNAELVTGSVVISIDHFKRMLALVRNIFGGQVKSYQSLVDRARREAILRMKEGAKQQGADMVLNLRLETAAIGYNANVKCQVGSVEVIASGTALTHKGPLKMKFLRKGMEHIVNRSKAPPLTEFFLKFGENTECWYYIDCFREGLINYRQVLLNKMGWLRFCLRLPMHFVASPLQFKNTLLKEWNQKVVTTDRLNRETRKAMSDNSSYFY